MAALGQVSGPVASILSPPSANAGSPSIVVYLIGRHFTPGSTVLWNGLALTSSFVSDQQISFSVERSLLSAAGSATIQVVTPFGHRSNPLAFSIFPAAFSVDTATLPAAAAKTQYSFQLTASGGLPPYRWSPVSPLPPGLALSADGVLTGVPPETGNFTFSVSALDANQQSSTRSLILAVSGSSFSITTPANLPPANIGEQYSLTFVAGTGVAPLRWQLGSEAPNGLNLDPRSGVLAGVPVAAGTYTFQVQVSDGSNTDSRTFTLVVRQPPLAITTLSPLFIGTVGVQYSQTFAAKGGTPPYVWSLEPDVPGLAFISASGSLTGTPQTAGSFTIRVRVQDREQTSTTQAFSLEIRPPSISIITGSTLPDGSAGVPYSLRFAATGGTAPYSWSILSGAVPAVFLDAGTGNFTGTPNTPGTFPLVLQVRDAAGLVSTKSFTLAIAPSLLKITSSPVPFDTTMTLDFSTAISASGGRPPYTWSANGLPAGLTIDTATGRISGAPAAGGTFLFTARVTDSAQAVATELFQINVGFPPLPDLTVIEAPQVANAAEQLPVRLLLGSVYPLPLEGELLLAFLPDVGAGDATIQFSSGGRTAPFSIPAGATTAAFSAGELALQTGTVAGTLILTARLRSSGADVTPTPIPVHTIRIERAAPVITNASFSRTADGVEIRITGYCTAREVTQALFRFSAVGSASLRTSEVALPVEDLFTRWFGDSAVSQFGSQFRFTQTFTIQGDAAAVVPASVTLINRFGNSTREIQP